MDGLGLAINKNFKRLEYLKSTDNDATTIGKFMNLPSIGDYSEISRYYFWSFRIFRPVKSFDDSYRERMYQQLQTVYCHSRSFVAYEIHGQNTTWFRKISVTSQVKNPTGRDIRR